MLILSSYEISRRKATTGAEENVKGSPYISVVDTRISNESEGFGGPI